MEINDIGVDAMWEKLGERLGPESEAIGPVLLSKGLVTMDRRPGAYLDIQSRLAQWVWGRHTAKNTMGTPTENDISAHLRMEVLGMANLLKDAWVVVWTQNMFEMGVAAANDLPDWIEATPDLLPRDVVLWLYETPHWYIADEADGGNRMVLGVLLRKADAELQIMEIQTLLNDGLLTVEIRGAYIPWHTVNDEPELQSMLKMMRFSQSPYLGFERGTVTRNFGRRAEGHGINPEISFIKLRRAIGGGPTQPPPPAEGVGVDWSCQWIVSAHWRRQYHPSDQTRRAVWIAPYLKGPPDKPLRSNPGLLMR